MTDQGRDVLAESEAAAPDVHAVESVFGRRYRALTLGILTVVLLVAFEGISVATAMPVAVRELHGLHLYAWGFSAFLVTSLVGMVVAGDVSDRRGPLVPFLVAVATFGVGLVIAGTAQTMPVFIAGRAVQGFGAGLNIVALYVVVGRAYPNDVRPRAFSVMSSGWVLPSIIGPPVAGALADHASWRWVFLGVPPLIVPAVITMLPRLRHLERDPDETPAVRGRGRLLAAVGAATGAALLQVAGTGEQWISLLWLAIGLALLVPGLRVLLPPGTLRGARGLPMTVLMRGVLAGAFFGAEAFIPLMLVSERGLATTFAGLTLTGAALTWTLGSWYQGRPSLRVSRPTLVQVGISLVGLGICLAALALWPVLPPAVAALGWLVGGLGMGLGMTSVSVLTLEQSDPADQGANSAAVQICDALGSVVFVGVAGSIYAAMHTQAGNDTKAFLTIFATMAGLALVGALIAPRVRAPDPL
jgi:MFS family permease